MIAVGVDVHKRQCALAMQFEDGELGSFEPFENTRAGWQELLTALPSEAGMALAGAEHISACVAVLPWAAKSLASHW